MKVLIQSSIMSSSTLTLNIKTLKGSNFSIVIPSNATVIQFQQAISDQHDIAIDKQRLIYRGKVLKNDKALAEYNIEDGDAIHLIVRADDAPPLNNNNAAEPSSNINNNAANPNISFHQLGDGGMAAAIAVDSTQDFDLNGIVNNVLQQIGIPGMASASSSANISSSAGSTASSSSANFLRNLNIPSVMTQAFPGEIKVNTIRESTNTIANNLSTRNNKFDKELAKQFIADNNINNNASPELKMDTSADSSAGNNATVPGVVSSPMPEDMNGVISALQQFNTAQQGVAQLTQRLTSALQLSNYSNTTATVAERAELQSQIAELGLLLRHFSSTYSGLGRLLAQISTDSAHPEAPLVLLDHPIGAGAQPIVSPIPQGSLAVQVQAMPALVSASNNSAAAQNNANNPIMQLLSRFAGATAANNAANSATNSSAAMSTANSNTATSNTTQSVPAQSTASASATNSAQNAPQTSIDSAGSSNSAPSQQNPLANLAQIFGPMISQVASAANTNNAGNSANNSANNPLAGLMNMVGPMLAQAGASINPNSANSAPNGQTNSNPGSSGESIPANNPLNNILSMMGPMLQQFSQQSGGNNAAQAAAAAAPANSPAPPATSIAPATTVAFPANPTVPSSANLAQVAAPTAPRAAPVAQPVAAAASSPNSGSSGTQNNPLAGFLSMLGGQNATSSVNQGQNQAPSGGNILGMLSGMLSGASGPNSGQSLNDLMASMLNNGNNNSNNSGNNDEESEEDNIPSIFDLFLSRIMRSLSMPDLLTIITGNFSPFDRSEEGLYELLSSLIDDDDCPENREEVANQLAESIVDGCLSDTILQPYSAQLKPNSNPKAASLPTLRQHFRKFVDLILDRHSSSANNRPAFSAEMKQWAMELTGVWIDVLVGCYNDGLITVEKLAKSALVAKFQAVGPEVAMFLPMVSGALTDAIMKSYHQYKQSQLLTTNLSSSGGSGTEAWLEFVPQNERKLWESVIEQDVKSLEQQFSSRRAQSNNFRSANNDDNSDSNAAHGSERSLFKPLSYAYLAGSGKGRRAATKQEGKSQQKNESKNVEAASRESEFQLGASFGSTLAKAIQRVEAKSADNDINSNTNNSGSHSVEAVVSALNNSSLQAEYRQQIIGDLNNRVASDSDYNPIQFPNIAQNIVQKH
jgi:uncharacterized ubiquitin-like protein YukD